MACGWSGCTGRPNYRRRERRAVAACLGVLTPEQRERVLAKVAGGGGGEGERLGIYSWTDLTYLLHKHHISWSYYVQSGIQPDCDDNPDESAAGCAPVRQGLSTPSIWNPLPSFTDVKADHQLGDIRHLSDFYPAARQGRLPAVSWIAPSQDNSDHPPANIAHRAGLRHQPDKHDHERTRVEVHGDLSGLG